ncbi:hypothetical protein LU293_01815 [Moraxella nasovis]|uniref:hypothetical protein n=1 Tax=Moraxella nasovis TaxID=2904121 RepID=UPI001F60427D|nr:hypothetical protein [Moraxella nasovis]UNU73673.1 hypothetical protein LU293_01815 [Moraxella nasovis]
MIKKHWVFISHFLRILGILAILAAVILAPFRAYVALVFMAVCALIADYILFSYHAATRPSIKQGKFKMLIMSAVVWICLVGLVFYIRPFG